MGDNAPEGIGSKFMTRFAAAAALVSLIGLADAGYLTATHFSGKEVPCSIISGCEKVLTSQYAEVGGIPTALFGAAAYFAAFSLTLFAYYGYTRLWGLFGALTVLMAVFTAWLIYLQAFVIGAFCQFCLISAATTSTLLLIFLLSTFFRKK